MEDRYLPSVSGSTASMRSPPRREPEPMIRKGRGAHKGSRVATKGATIPPSLPHRELAPTAVLLGARCQAGGQASGGGGGVYYTLCIVGLT